MAATRAATDAELAAGGARLVAEALRSGTTTLECKSGYGLTVADEVRSLRVARDPHRRGHLARRARRAAGAHPRLLRRPAVRARWPTPARRWPAGSTCSATAGRSTPTRRGRCCGPARPRGLLARVHANQLGPGPGVRLAVEVGAASADHCSRLSAADVDALAGSGTVATLLPAAEFSTRAPWPDARRLLDAGVTVALASDCNPGTSYTTSLPFGVALAVREMGMTPAEAVWSATAGGARALRRTDVGHLAPGARADLVLLDAPTPDHLAYRPGVDLVRQVWQAGRPVHTRPGGTL